jgi:shikimate kinase
MQLARTERDRNRPLLQIPNPAQKLAELMALRDPLYRSTAHHIVPTSEGAARDLALRIIQLVQRPQTR